GLAPNWRENRTDLAKSERPQKFGIKTDILTAQTYNLPTSQTNAWKQGNGRLQCKQSPFFYQIQAIGRHT
ncbi:MAG: hypothetical protein WAS33_00200, partial [Candidatus Promineifilaceae bacterium]